MPMWVLLSAPQWEHLWVLLSEHRSAMQWAPQWALLSVLLCVDVNSFSGYCCHVCGKYCCSGPYMFFIHLWQVPAQHPQ